MFFFPLSDLISSFASMHTELLCENTLRDLNFLFMFYTESSVCIISITVAVFSLIQASFPGNLHLVLVLRPTSFFHRTVTDIGFRFSQDDFMLKMPVRQLLLVYQICLTSWQGTTHSCSKPALHDLNCVVNMTKNTHCFQFLLLFFLTNPDFSEALVPPKFFSWPFILLPTDVTFICRWL